MEKIIKIKARSKKRLGRGYGSGKGGHTVGRGAKGMKARGHVGLMFEGGKTKKSLIKRLPLQRGKGKFKYLKPKPLAVDVVLLNFFSKGDKVTLETLIKKGIVTKKALVTGVKILGNDKVLMPLKVELPCSKNAAAQIEAAGGTVGEKEPPKSAPVAKAKQKKTVKPTK
ncbi:50S ribosomal protein L15 [Patescibacteria group bacterium]|nr:50S ribosomal protein L15 [Patescibacteria group bacterium]